MIPTKTQEITISQSSKYLPRRRKAIVLGDPFSYPEAKDSPSVRAFSVRDSVLRSRPAAFDKFGRFTVSLMIYPLAQLIIMKPLFPRSSSAIHGPQYPYRQGSNGMSGSDSFLGELHKDPHVLRPRLLPLTSTTWGYLPKMSPTRTSELTSYRAPAHAARTKTTAHVSVHHSTRVRKLPEGSLRKIPR